LVNGGDLIPPTFLKRTEEQARALAVRVIKPETSAQMRYLLRLNVEKGTATRADVKGYYVGAKTGTAEKVVDGHYSKHKLLNTFTAILPADNPRYVLLILIDEPQPTPESNGIATSGMNAAPTAAKIIARVAPMLGLEPRFDLPQTERLMMVKGMR
jgi:cell division protein FtsI (penicillin-binding protein 3)